MNVDFLALSSAVQQANNVTAVGMDMDSAPRKVPLRRRSSKAGTSASALQFLEAAHKSWSDLPDDLGETTALQRRKSLRSDRTGTADGGKVVLSPEVGHRSWTFGENRKNSNDTTDSPLLKEGSSKVLPPRGGSCRISRRASMGGNKKTPTIAEEPSVPDTDDDEPVKEKTSKRGKLTRRSSLQVASDHSRSKEKTASKENSTRAGRRTTGASAENSRSAGAAGGGGAGPRMTRRNTVSHCTNMDDSNTESLTKPPPPPPQKPTRQSSLSANGSSSKINSHHHHKTAKGNVRFELDHKNRIKRRVSFIRAQNAKTDERKLWWSEEELDRIYERENKVYERYADNRTYKRKIQRLWGSCSKAAGPSGGGGVKPLSPESLSHVAGSPCRGLEVDILETVRDRRARVIGSLLDAQDTLREFDPNIRTKVLSARYKNLCRAATRFARKMGEGDALEAANVYSN